MFISIIGRDSFIFPVTGLHRFFPSTQDFTKRDGLRYYLCKPPSIFAFFVRIKYLVRRRA